MVRLFTFFTRDLILDNVGTVFVFRRIQELLIHKGSERYAGSFPPPCPHC
jgi:hypothetical protein